MKKYIGSMRAKILCVFLGMSIPAILLFFFISIYAIKQIEQRIYNNNLNLLNVHINELETELSSVSQILVSKSIEQNNLNRFSSSDSRTRYEATIAYHKENKDVLKSHNLMEGQIAYSPENGNTVMYFNGLDPDYQQRQKIMQYVKEHYKELTAINGKWKSCCINGKWILIGAAGNEKAIFCFWTTYNILMKPVENWQLPEKSEFCFASQQGEIFSDVKNVEMKSLSYNGELDTYYFDGENDKYLISGVETSIGDFRLMNVVEREACLGIFPQIQSFGGIFLLLILGIGVPGVIYILNKSIFVPVDKMEEVIFEVEKGNLDTQIAYLKSSKEMEHLIQSFNEMIVQVKNLKIDTYEKDLEKQKLELDYLNLQMEPHFYLNALNVIDVTAQVGDMELIHEMVQNLSQYMRYIMGSRKECVTLQEELEHVSHYLKIMEIRLGDNFSYIEEIDADLLTVEIPPLTIQTLVENSMKYAFDVYKDTVVKVKAVKEGECILIFVIDNGEGYPESYLENYKKAFSEKGKHIGIMNLSSRLKMMFGDRVSLTPYNLKHSGACTEIRINLLTSNRPGPLR